MKLERVTIPNNLVTLAALAYEPDGLQKPVCVVLAHGFTASKESLDLLAAYLCGRGYTCLSFDFRGHKLGGSTGEMTGIRDAISDLDAAARAAMQRFERPRCVLVGHSMGGIAGFAVATYREDVAAIASIAAGPEPSKAFTSTVGRAMLAQRADYVSGAEADELMRQLDGLTDYVESMGQRPSLFVAAKNDVLVNPAKMREWAERAGDKAEFAEIEGGHLEAPDRARGVVANWLDSALTG